MFNTDLEGLLHGIHPVSQSSSRRFTVAVQASGATGGAGVHAAAAAASFLQTQTHGQDNTTRPRLGPSGGQLTEPSEPKPGLSL